MIRKLLIANRGEIVSRIIRTCRRMGIAAVAVYSEADRGACYLSEADESVCIGPANPMLSYLNIEALVRAAQQTGADAVHPGYGFLSERGAFAEAVENAGLIWVGPSSQLLRTISSKCVCRHMANEVGVPVIPGSLDPVEDVQDVVSVGHRYGYPLFLKLDKGGGGKGIEKVSCEEEIPQVLERAGRIGKVAFGSGSCYVESVVERPRHIEVQFLADGRGSCICLGERECSIQRRHQKLVEEAPSMVVTAEDRQALFDWTRRLVLHMGYRGAGTIEGLRSRDGSYFFMEINARLQVEHPVTEFLTGLDIVELQLRIASGEELRHSQDEIPMRGHAVEARIYAEDPETFFPSPGTITALDLPQEDSHLRIEHAIHAQGVVPPYYDPLLAKVITWDVTRNGAVERLIAALKSIRIEGVKTTIPTSLKILEHPMFREGNFNTGSLEEWLAKK